MDFGNGPDESEVTLGSPCQDGWESTPGPPDPDWTGRPGLGGDVPPTLEEVVLSCNELALRCLNEGDRDAAFGLLRQADAHAARPPASWAPEAVRAQQRLLAVTHNNWAVFHRRDGDLRQALQRVRRALAAERALALAGPDTAATHLNASAILSRMGRHRLALQHAHQSLEALSSAVEGDADASLVAVAHHSAGAQYEFLNEAEQACEHYLWGFRLAMEQLGMEDPTAQLLWRSYAKCSSRLQSRSTQQTPPKAPALPRLSRPAPRGSAALRGHSSDHRLPVLAASRPPPASPLSPLSPQPPRAPAPFRRARPGSAESGSQQSGSGDGSLPGSPGPRQQPRPQPPSSSRRPAPRPARAESPAPGRAVARGRAQLKPPPTPVPPPRPIVIPLVLQRPRPPSVAAPLARPPRPPSQRPRRGQSHPPQGSARPHRDAAVVDLLLALRSQLDRLEAAAGEAGSPARTDSRPASPAPEGPPPPPPRVAETVSAEASAEARARPPLSPDAGAAVLARVWRCHAAWRALCGRWEQRQRRLEAVRLTDGQQQVDSGIGARPPLSPDAGAAVLARAWRCHAAWRALCGRWEQRQRRLEAVRLTDGQRRGGVWADDLPPHRSALSAAATSIAAWWHGVVARRSECRAMVVARRAAEERYVAGSVRRYAAVRVQRAVRRFLAVRAGRRQERTAIRLQTWWRERHSRERYIQVRQLSAQRLRLLRSRDAALALTGPSPSHRQAALVQAFLRARHSSLVLGAVNNRRSDVTVAVLCLQHAWRLRQAYLAASARRQRRQACLQRVLQLERSYAARVIQRYFRAWQGQGQPSSPDKNSAQRGLAGVAFSDVVVIHEGTLQASVRATTVDFDAPAPARFRRRPTGFVFDRRAAAAAEAEAEESAAPQDAPRVRFQAAEDPHETRAFSRCPTGFVSAQVSDTVEGEEPDPEPRVRFQCGETPSQPHPFPRAPTGFVGPQASDMMEEDSPTSAAQPRVRFQAGAAADARQRPRPLGRCPTGFVSSQQDSEVMLEEDLPAASAPPRVRFPAEVASDPLPRQHGLPRCPTGFISSQDSDMLLEDEQERPASVIQNWWRQRTAIREAHRRRRQRAEARGLRRRHDAARTLQARWRLRCAAFRPPVA